MFDKVALLAAVAWHGVVARVVIAGFEGSAPRETGAAMLVWVGGQSGTIGGGALEWQAIAQAQGMLDQGVGLHLARVPLGPSLGQCCGGAVTLLTEVYDRGAADALADHVIARPVDGREMPLAVKRLLANARGTGALPPAQLLQGWMVEAVAQARRHLWIWGAGHVGRALVGVLAPLPDVAITWVDVAMDRFPAEVPVGVRALPVPNPVDAVALAPNDAEHLILTYSHALDLDLCHRLLLHGFDRAGLIGSATKWARFRSRLAALGHAPQDITRIQCPIGEPALGKHPQQIAIGVAAAFLRGAQQSISRQESIL
jgi:xanthine dehydrogenase accessory factor